VARAGRRVRSRPRRAIATLFTVGHGTLAAEAFVALLETAKVTAIVDVRRFPASRRHPQFAREAMAGWLGEAGIGYRWKEALGGRRRGVADSPNAALHNSAFRAYADHMASAEFRAAVDRLLAQARERPTAVMCAETLWWHCHRRLIADAAELLHGMAVAHVMPPGKLAPPCPDGRGTRGRRPAGLRPRAGPPGLTA
jgi:uncharacterized protein (DUF488 family)